MISIVDHLMESARELLTRVNKGLQLKIVHLKSFSKRVGLRLEHVKSCFYQVLLYLILDHFDLTCSAVIKFEDSLFVMFALVDRALLTFTSAVGGRSFS